MTARETRGLAIATQSQIQQGVNGWRVSSYEVTMGMESPRCTCPDFRFRGGVCKHAYAVYFDLAGAVGQSCGYCGA